MMKAPLWTVCALLVAQAVVLAVVFVPPPVMSVRGRARPFSDVVSPAAVWLVMERCRESMDIEEHYTLGPTRRREDGSILVGALSGDKLVVCSADGTTVAVSTTDPGTSVRDHPFELGLGTGTTMVGYAGADVAAVDFRTPDGQVVPARVHGGIYLVDLPGPVDWPAVTHVAYDAAGAVLPGR